MNYFDQQSYDRDDLRAKLAISGWLSSHNYQIKSNPDIYGIDLIVSPTGAAPTIYLECEIRHSWRAGKWPFSSHETSARKLKYTGVNSWVATLRSDLKAAVMSPLTGAFQIVTKSVGRAQQEAFLSMPTGCMRYYNIA